MQFVRNFEDLFELACAKGAARRRVATVFPHDEHTLEAVEGALRRGFADFILVGKSAELEALPFVDEFADRIEIVDVSDSDEAARVAVQIVRDGGAEVLMKGKLNTDNLLRAVLNKEHGILPQGQVLSHVTVAEIPNRDKLLIYSDVAVIPEPTLAQREAIMGYLTNACRMLGIEEPRIALIHFTEKVNPKFPVSTDYVALKEMAAEGRWGKAIVDGPMDIPTAVEPEAGRIKGIVSPIEGKADALMLPNIQAANVFYKTLTYFGGATNAGMLVGTMAPVVLPSRGDSTQGKLASLALACVSAMH